jgi:DNA processing protein
MPTTDSVQAAVVDSESQLWLRLVHLPGLGRRSVMALLRRFGKPASVFSASLPELAHCVGLRAAERLWHSPHRPANAPDRALLELLARTAAWLEDMAPGQGPRRLLPIDDPAYPARLAAIEDPPPLLYVQGRVDLLARPALAIIGARNATHQGRANAHAFARTLSRCGLTIVSGMALGIDGAAHEGGLDGEGSTVAVVGTGLDRVYPAAHHALAGAIAATGCLVSEYPLGTGALAKHFPRRNRIISGLACGVLVVEAAARSGSLITARLAGDQGRDVFALPGSIHSPLSKGCHQLIRQGAMLVEEAEDILAALRDSPLVSYADGLPLARPALVSPENNSENANAELTHPCLSVIGFDPVDLDTLLQLTGRPIGELGAVLLALELAGEIERLPGGLLQRVKPTPPRNSTCTASD